MTKLTIVTKGKSYPIQAIPDLARFYTEKAYEIYQITSSSELTEDEQYLIFTFEDDQSTEIFNFIEKNKLSIVRIKPYYEA